MGPEDRLANEWINALSSLTPPYSAGTPLQAGTLLNTTLAKFIRENVTLLGAYSGVIPGTPPVPEVLPADEVSIIGELPPSITGDFNTWIKDIETKLKTLMFVGTGATSPIGSIMAFPTTTILLTQKMVGDAYLSTVDEYGRVVSSNPQFECMKTIAKAILDAIKIGFIPTYPATLVGTGVFTVASVKIV